MTQHRRKSVEYPETQAVRFSAAGRYADDLMPPLTAVVVFIIFLLLPTVSMAETIRIGGSGGPLPLIEMLADNYQDRFPDVQFNILPSLGSGGGIRALFDGVVDIAITSRPLSEKEKALNVTYSLLGRTPFILVSSSEKGLKDVSLQELAAIYRGDISKWPDGTPIRLVLRPRNDSDFIALQEMSSEMDQAVQAAVYKEGMIMAATDGESTEMIEHTFGALGTSTLAQILLEKRDFNVFSINGIAPSMESLNNGSYPYYKEFYVVTDSEPTEQVASFLSYVFSEESITILQKSGCWETLR